MNKTILERKFNVTDYNHTWSEFKNSSFLPEVHNSYTITLNKFIPYDSEVGRFIRRFEIEIEPEFRYKYKDILSYDYRDGNICRLWIYNGNADLVNTVATKLRKNHLLKDIFYNTITDTVENFEDFVRWYYCDGVCIDEDDLYIYDDDIEDYIENPVYADEIKLCYEGYAEECLHYGLQIYSEELDLAAWLYNYIKIKGVWYTDPFLYAQMTFSTNVYIYISVPYLYSIKIYK